MNLFHESFLKDMTFNGELHDGIDLNMNIQWE